MQPHYWALHIEQTTFKTISVPEIDGGHPRSPPPIVATIIALDGLLPEISNAAVAVLAEPNIDQKVTELVIGLKVRSLLFSRPRINVSSEQSWRVPAAQCSSTFGFIVKGCTERDDAFDLNDWY